MWFKRKQDPNIKHKLEIKALECKNSMLQYELRSEEWKSKQIPKLSFPHEPEDTRKRQLEFSHDRWLEFYYKHQVISEILNEIK